MKKMFIYSLIMLPLLNDFVEAKVRDNGLKGTTVIYLNGLGNTDEQAIANVEEIRKLYEKYPSELLKIDQKDGQPRVEFTNVHVGDVHGRDLLDKIVSIRLYGEQALRLKIPVIGQFGVLDVYMEAVGSILFDGSNPKIPKISPEIDEFLHSLSKDILTLDPVIEDAVSVTEKVDKIISSERRALTLAHSQGSLYDNHSYFLMSVSKKFEGKLECQMGSLHLGSAAPEILNPFGSYVTVEGDVLYEKISSKDISILKPNYKILDGIPSRGDGNHSLLATYLKPEVLAFDLSNTSQTKNMVQIVSDEYSLLSDDLDKNCKMRCGGKPGRTINGAFVADTATVHSDAFFSGNIEICDDAKVGAARLFVMGEGAVVVDKNAKVGSFSTIFTNGKVHITNNSQMYDNSFLNAMNWMGGAGPEFRMTDVSQFGGSINMQAGSISITGGSVVQGRFSLNGGEYRMLGRTIISPQTTVIGDSQGKKPLIVLKNTELKQGWFSSIGESNVTAIKSQLAGNIGFGYASPALLYVEAKQSLSIGMGSPTLFNVVFNQPASFNGSTGLANRSCSRMVYIGFPNLPDLPDSPDAKCADIPTIVLQPEDYIQPGELELPKFPGDPEVPELPIFPPMLMASTSSEETVETSTADNLVMMASSSSEEISVTSSSSLSVTNTRSPASIEGRGMGLSRQEMDFFEAKMRADREKVEEVLNRVMQRK